MTIITLGDIRAKRPCADGWAKLTKALGTTDLAVELSIGDIVISNGLDDAMWALRCLTPREAVAAVMPAVKRASVHTTDQRVHDCIAAVDRWLAGDDSVDLKAARAAAARDAARAAAAARDAARAAAVATAAARAAARAAAAAAEAARAAAAAAEAAWEARDAAAEAAWEARDAAWEAARAAAAREAAWEAAAREAAKSAAAWEAAWDAERDMQAFDLFAMFPPIRLKAEAAA